MLKWKKDINGYTGHWTGGYIGFEDDCPLYRVGPGTTAGIMTICPGTT